MQLQLITLTTPINYFYITSTSNATTGNVKGGGANCSAGPVTLRGSKRIMAYTLDNLRTDIRNYTEVDNGANYSKSFN